MIDIVDAIDELGKSIKRYKKRNCCLTVDIIEAEVINNACLHILKNQREQESDSSNVLINNINRDVEINQIVNIFIEAAKMLYPTVYTHAEIAAARLSIPQNVSWPGMWAFLKNYFQENHDINIDGTVTSPEHFHSSYHRRYENGQFVIESKANRIVKLSYSPDMKDVLVSVEPTLSPKQARLISKSDNIHIYNGIDPDFRFTVHFHKFGGIQEFILERLDLGLKLCFL